MCIPYINALSVSHFIQVRSNSKGGIHESDLFHFRDWDLERLILDSNDLINHVAGEGYRAPFCGCFHETFYEL